MTTVSALDKRKAASSALPVLTGFFSPSAAASLVSPPKPPRITLKNERFIALHMMYDRIAPDDPTSDPAMISIGLSRENPIPAAAHPYSVLSIEIARGISAPPIGMMSRKPNRNASAVMMMKGVQCAGAGVMQNQMPQPIIAMPSARLTK